MGSINEYEYEMLSDCEKTAYVSPYKTVYDLTKLKNKKNRKNEDCRTDRYFENFPSYPSD
jgi:hypothetical protein